MARKAIKDSFRSGGLVPILLVFEALLKSRLSLDSPDPSTFKRAAALKEGPIENSKHFASRQVRDALGAKNGLDMMNIDKGPLGSPVLVYCFEKVMCKGTVLSLIKTENILQPLLCYPGLSVALTRTKG